MSKINANTDEVSAGILKELAERIVDYDELLSYGEEEEASELLDAIVEMARGVLE